MSIENGISYPRPEILHLGIHDVIINKSLKNNTLVNDVLSKVSRGIPTTWEPYSPWSEWIAEENDGVTNLYIDSNSCPKYIAKLRKNLNHRLLPANLNRIDSVDRQWLAMASLLNEMKVSPIVRDTLKSSEGLLVAKKYGLKTIEFVEPLISLINREGREKITFYPFFAGQNILLGKNDTLDRLQHHENSLIKELAQLFKASGIYAGDFDFHQFLAPEPTNPGFGKLYLLDIEGFYKITA